MTYFKGGYYDCLKNCDKLQPENVYIHMKKTTQRIVLYFTLMIPSIINILSQIKVCTEDKLLEGYTQESYMSMLSDKMKLLEELRWEFINSLHDF